MLMAKLYESPSNVSVCGFPIHKNLMKTTTNEDPRNTGKLNRQQINHAFSGLEL